MRAKQFERHDHKPEMMRIKITRQGASEWLMIVFMASVLLPVLGFLAVLIGAIAFECWQDNPIITGISIGVLAIGGVATLLDTTPNPDNSHEPTKDVRNG